MAQKTQHAGVSLQLFQIAEGREWLDQFVYPVTKSCVPLMVRMAAMCKLRHKRWTR